MPQFRAEKISDDRFSIVGSEARHMAVVLRFRAGETVTLFDTQGKRYIGQIDSINPKVVQGKIIKELQRGELKVTVLHLYQALCRDFGSILRKVTEIGIDTITPITTQRTIIQITNDKINEKVQRWERIILSAMKQCNRFNIPKLGPIMTFQEALREITRKQLSLIAWEKEKKNRLRDILTAINKFCVVNIFIGPEGSFTTEEMILAKKYGCIPFRLGENILRVETAAIVTCGIILELAQQ